VGEVVFQDDLGRLEERGIAFRRGGDREFPDGEPGEDRSRDIPDRQLDPGPLTDLILQPGPETLGIEVMVEIDEARRDQPDYRQDQDRRRDHHLSADRLFLFHLPDPFIPIRHFFLDNTIPAD